MSARWEVSPSRRFDGRVEVTRDTGGNGHPVVALVEHAQDAALIAAAPELLEALESLAKQTADAFVLPDHACAECVPGGEMVQSGFACGRHAARAAIAKARGGR